MHGADMREGKNKDGQRGHLQSPSARLLHVGSPPACGFARAQAPRRTRLDLISSRSGAVSGASPRKHRSVTAPMRNPLAYAMREREDGATVRLAGRPSLPALAPPPPANPWRLLPWSVPAAALVALMIFVLDRWVGRTIIPRASYVEIRVIPPIAMPPSAPGPPAASPVRMTHASSVARGAKAVKPRHLRAAHHPKLREERKSFAARTPAAAGPPSGVPSAPSAAPSTPPAERSAPGGTGAAGGLGAASEGAQALYTPLPEIPADLRSNPLNTIAVARFTVASDGSATVALVKATPYPELNDLLLRTLRRWRFSPALKDGKPVASNFEVRIPVVVE
ncbi:MAG TPA: TonB family protein [Candidatus Binataceae bacterium]|nr:TonB family protein [Candidatus Binataceae bacterium]